MSTYRDIKVQALRTHSSLNVVTGVTWISYSPGGSWELQSITLEDLTSAGDVTRFQFVLKLKRLRTYYVMNIIIPVLFLSLTASLVFYLPADAGEKIGMSMTVLLAYAVYLTIIADNMPKTSTQVSLLAVYLTILLAVTAFGVVLSVVVLNLHHTSEETPVGPRIEAFTRVARRFLRLGHHSKEMSSKVRPVLNTPATTLTDADYMSAKGHQLNQQSPPSDTRSPSKHGYMGSQLRGGQNGTSELLARSFASMPSNVDERETITWAKVAETIDRLLFLSFTSFVFLITIILLPYMALKS
ncbi:neuronal acetylcholine receptor subunit alpha-7 [Elysia marginata]|uniref:Neuronal acetylcholine receptor subunit alpha-7 n=1 Tax=Elysia marginata TaxID=1093978 RepID=A0AAV4JDA6_9GAST|nr:neuronal acetylcholine receptor subunit alpha-7 [Elysia marginata]